MVVCLDLVTEEVLGHGSMLGLLRRLVNFRLVAVVDLVSLHASVQEQACLCLEQVSLSMVWLRWGFLLW